MAYRLSEINAAARRDPVGLMEECDRDYQGKIARAADKICENMKKSPVVLLSGPSGSGKTTTAEKLGAELERRGVRTHPVSMDDYFMRPDTGSVPRTPDGAVDYESPELMDLKLLDEHFAKLTRGEWILVPKFEFPRQMRNDSRGRPLKLGRDEVAIFEGIHALNTSLTLWTMMEALCSSAPGCALPGGRCGTTTSGALTCAVPWRCGPTCAGGRSCISPPTGTPPTSNSTPPWPTRFR